MNCRRLNYRNETEGSKQ